MDKIRQVVTIVLLFYAVTIIGSIGCGNSNNSSGTGGLSAPANLRVTAVGDNGPLPAAPGTASLAWDASSGAAFYHVYVGTKSGGPYNVTEGCSADAPVTTCTVEALKLGSTYYFVVQAANSDGSMDSGYSNEVSVTIPLQ